MTEEEKQAELRYERICKIWHESRKLAVDDPVVKYLTNRKVMPVMAPETLRFHPYLMYMDDNHKRHYSGMVGFVQDPDGQVVSLHRTYLYAHGAKAEVESPRKLMPPVYPGSMNGSAIRLAPPNHVHGCEEDGMMLGVAEGVETALSVIKYAGMPCWSTISAMGLRSVVIPDYVKTVVIWGDNDESGVGQQASYDLASRLISEGKRVKIMLPDETGTDWADVD